MLDVYEHGKALLAIAFDLEIPLRKPVARARQ
jgi:hypothetical protein